MSVVPKIRVLVIDDHPVVRHGLASMLRYAPDLEVLGEAADGAEGLRMLHELRPDLALIDLRMPRLGGVEVMEQARAAGIPTRFLVLTTYDTDEYIGPALAAGAQGYLLKDAPPEDLLRAVRTLMRGHAALEPAVAARLLAKVSAGSASDELSARELDVLRLLVRGESNKAIAVGLDLSENTVKSHLSRIFEKLGVRSRTEAAMAAIQRGLLPRQ
jgi:DNA-binding NarL/FixJ family response regulator